jgi:hypothetical protein
MRLFLDTYTIFYNLLKHHLVYNIILRNFLNPMETTENQTSETPKVSKKTKKLPESDISLADVAQKVAEAWGKSSLILQWISVKDFQKMAEDFATHLRDRKVEGLTRPQLTQKLKELDKQIDKNLVYVKNYLLEEVGKGNETSYYAQLGIEKVSTAYKLPSDRNNRLSALNILLKGIQDRGYGDRQYGTAFWQPIVTEYSDLMKQANSTDSAVTSKVNTKNQSKEQVLKVLNALIFLIRANFPDNYTAELRVWGFQKEKY